MNCVASISYSIFVNGRTGEKIVPIRGLRQEDPISPYIFIMYAEGLSTMINFAETRKKIKVVFVIGGGTQINHLLFTVDCVLFSRVNMGDWSKLEEILSIYLLKGIWLGFK